MLQRRDGDRRVIEFFSGFGRWRGNGVAVFADTYRDSLGLAVKRDDFRHVRERLSGLVRLVAL